MKASRPDKPYVDQILKTAYSAGVVVLALLVVNLLLVGVIVVLLKQPRLVTVIERDTGKTYAQMSREVTDDLVERQLIYYSRQFIEDYFTMDYSVIEGARKRAFEIMHSNMRNKIGEAWLTNDEVRRAQHSRTGTAWEWNITPSVTMKNDPVYNVFAQVTRRITRDGYRPVEERFGLLLKWGRLDGGVEPFKRPHQLVLLGQEDITNDKTKLNEQINLSYK